MAPVFVIVPGSFASSPLYVPLREKIESLGYDSYILPLRTVGLLPVAPNMYDDAAFIADEVRKLADQGREVVIMAHSYGGVPMSQSTKGLTIQERSKAGLSGGIKRLIYVSAMAPTLNSNLVGDDLSALPPAIGEAINRKDQYFPRALALGMAPYTFSDASPEVTAGFLGFFQEQAVSGYTDHLTHNGYKDVPATYIKCTSDVIVLPPKQDEQISNLKAVSPSVDVREIDAGHAPMSTQPEKFAGIIQEILAAA